MARLFNDPGSFAEEMLEGFAAAQAHRVRRVPGGVVRRNRSRSGEVAVVIGGGSGHYPAFSGLVGDGLAHGAAMGNLFASPSAQQVRSVATSAHHGGGVLLCYGNYAGDVLHFGLAEQRLRGDGIDCRTVVVTDDVSSAPPEERDKRRGVAGDLVVFKAASAAAEEGYDLDEVARVAARANERTRSFGVAFGGCTLPGSAEPLFTVPEGKMAVGLGIHGEPGIDEQDVPTADELAELFVRTLLAEVPDGVEIAGSRVAVVLNGLGSVKYEELFVVYRRVAGLLAEAGVAVVEPEVGELVTSFDMAGASLTLCWLDEELERFWRAPADSAAYRKTPSVAADDAEAAEDCVALDVIPPATDESRESARCALAALDALKSTVDDNVAELGRIDAVAGDGDHGIGMQRGADAAVAAARDAVERGAGAGSTLNRAADAWADRAGGTSGALWGVALRAIGAELGDETAPGPRTIGAAVRAASDAVVRLGKAELGDKTMVDALVPFADELEAALGTGADLTTAWDTAATAAAKAAEATASLRPLRGRARPLAEKSLGTPDAGAVSLSLITRSVHAVLAR
ncbi:dihydroxyacetone kinase family protein [Saccharopolyspora sp. NFXS83]|uniref:dihydroxyacetone kinase family protein n=1 Tax=Saccharopolyspora sp. NFXS83 TaxID=2993560 RepID=UPI00224B4014|nr:dihydroxyacetone kinase family protein [Saccharopolyspora sp. NFXS83]MCX2731964.1 dihydroxyacetone kinase family protein [Saccharopolyspora sp. NFXS83]